MVIIMFRALKTRLRALVRRPILRVRGELSRDLLRKRGLRIAENVYVGEGTRFDNGFLWLISVGDNTTISSNVTILAHDGATKKGVGYSQIAPVAIGRDVYIGAGSIILPGVTIGDGAIVGAGSVVRHHVAAGTVVAGNPARAIRPVADFVERHQELTLMRPCYPAVGWTYKGGITSVNQAKMLEDLKDGPGYVE